MVNQVELGIRNWLAESERSKGLVKETEVSWEVRDSKMQDFISVWNQVANDGARMNMKTLCKT